MSDAGEFGRAYVEDQMAREAFFSAAARYKDSVAAAQKDVNVNLGAAVAAGELIGLIFKEMKANHKLSDKGRVILRPIPRFSNPAMTEDRNRVFSLMISPAINKHFPYEHLNSTLDTEERKGVEAMRLIA